MDVTAFTDDHSNYVAIAAIGVSLLIYGIFGRYLENLLVSSATFFIGAGLLIGPLAIDAISADASRSVLRVLAELTLAVVLCTGSAKTRFRGFKQGLTLPMRLIFISLPLSIVFGAAIAWLMFPELGWIGAWLLAIVLAPTDADLARPVVNDARVSETTRVGLEVESGLNDGVCVPILLALAALALETAPNHITKPELIIHFLANELGIGAAIGLGISALFLSVSRLTHERYLVRGAWQLLPLVSLALSTFGVAQILGGSGLIAAFLSGVLVSIDKKSSWSHRLEASEGFGDILSALTWLCFGVILAVTLKSFLDWRMLLYAVLSLTVVRVLPVFGALLGTNIVWRERVLIGWFGPRGLASIAFVMLLLDRSVISSNSPIVHISAIAVFCSAFLHGISASPLAGVLGRNTVSGRTNQ